MDLSIYSPESNFTLGHGYSEALFSIITSLQKLGHRIPFNDPAVQVQLNFGQPSFCADFYRKDQYSIAYFPWESTEIPSDWYDCLEYSDEVWTTSDWCFDVYKSLGLNVTNVYQHGIDPKWKPRKRPGGEVLRFLHLGDPASRKGAQLAYDAFKETFGDKKDVELIIKAADHTTVRKTVHGAIRPVNDDNVKIRLGFLKEDVLISLYHQVDCMVYPSYGEGFGLIPFQAIATGMPAIAPGAWAPYRSYLGNLSVDSQYIDSPWKKMHPGKVMKPDFDDLCSKYQYVYDNYDALQQEFYAKSFKLHEEYDWLTLTEKSTKKLVERFA